MPSSILWSPTFRLTFDFGQCFKGSALCPLPFDLSEVYLYNCPAAIKCTYKRVQGQGAEVCPVTFWPLIHSFCSKQAQVTSRFPPPLPTVAYCISLHVTVIDGGQEIFYWSVMTFDWGNANTNPLKLPIDMDIHMIRWRTGVWIWTSSRSGHLDFNNHKVSTGFATVHVLDWSLKTNSLLWRKV